MAPNSMPNVACNVSGFDFQITTFKDIITRLSHLIEQKITGDFFFFLQKMANKPLNYHPVRTTHISLPFFCSAMLVFTPGYERLLDTIMLAGPAPLPVYVDRLSRSSETSG